jgi:hypothetical protein
MAAQNSDSTSDRLRVLPNVVIFLFCISPLLGIAQQNKKHATHSAVECDTTLWNHVWNPDRLEIISSCVTVTGRITESHKESDGDLHLLLKPDGAFNNIINAVNTKEKNGCLVIEVICVGKSKETKEKIACDDYKNHVYVPHKGERVRITGSLVKDLHHGWNEIHPVTKIKRIDPKG